MVLVMIYVCMIKVIASMQFLLRLEIFEIMVIELEHDQMGWYQGSVKLSLFM